MKSTSRRRAMMTNLKALSLPCVLAALASASTFTYAASCTTDNAPRWVHESEAYEGCTGLNTPAQAKPAEKRVADATLPDERHHATAKKERRSPFRDDTAA